MKKECLFIGGPSDGQWRETEPLEFIKLPDPMPPYRATVKAYETDTVHVTLYRRERIYINEMHDHITFYVEHKLPVAEAIKMLFAGYKKP